MKRTVLLFCVAVLIGILAGCVGEHGSTLPSADTAPSGTTAPPVTETAEPSQTTQPTEAVAAIPPTPPENPGSSLCAYDPDRQIYISSENIYMDYYLGITDMPPVIIEVYSKEYIDPAQVAVELPEHSPFYMTVWPYEVVRDTVYNASTEPESWYAMPYHVYYTYRGGDPAMLDDDPQLLREFQALKPEDLPEFYRISVRLYLDPEKADQPATLEKVAVIIGDQTYEIDLGRIRVFPGEAFPADTQETVLGREQRTANIQHYNDGIVPLTVYIPQHRVSEDITLTGLRMADEVSEVLGVSIIESSAEGETETKWDGKTPIQLKKGQWIHFRVFIKNGISEKLFSRLYLQSILEYTKDGSAETVSIVTSHLCYTPTNAYENYAIIFDGVDMEPYYREYYYVHTDPMIDEYRNQ